MLSALIKNHCETKLDHSLYYSVPQSAATVVCSLDEFLSIPPVDVQLQRSGPPSLTERQVVPYEDGGDSPLGAFFCFKYCLDGLGRKQTVEVV